MSTGPEPTVWFPAIRAGTGADVFTERLCAGLNARGIRAQIDWLPHRAEYAPWTVRAPKPPDWANIVHVNTWLHGRFVPHDRAVVASMLHCVHDPGFRPYKTPAQALYHRFYIKPLERRMLARADAVVAISRYTGERTRDAFGPVDIHIITLGMDTDGPFRPVPRTAPHEPFRLAYVGTGSRRKGVDLLAPIMRQLGPAFHLDVAGTASIGASQLPDNIQILGRLPSTHDLVDLYQRSDALLFPSRLEGFGQVAIEAMACGLPVIATRGSSLMEVVDDGITGLLCGQDDVAEFARAAQQLASDRSLWVRIAADSPKRVGRLFSYSSMLDAYIGLYRITLSGRRLHSRRAIMSRGPP